MNDEPSELMSDDDRIQAIFEAAKDYGHPWIGQDESFVVRRLSDAIDAALAHADLAGYRRGIKDAREMEKACRAMNETGQGEHMGVAA